MKRKVVMKVVQFYLDLTITAYDQVEAARKDVAVLTDVNRDLMAENLRLEQKIGDLRSQIDGLKAIGIAARESE